MIETRRRSTTSTPSSASKGWTRSTSAPRTCRWRWAASRSFDVVEPKVAQAIDHIVARAKAHGVVAGIHNGRSDVAKARIAKGFRFVTVSSGRAPDRRRVAAGAGEMRQR